MSTARNTACPSVSAIVYSSDARARRLPAFEHGDRVAVNQVLDIRAHARQPVGARIGVQLGRVHDLVAERAARAASVWKAGKFN